MENSLMANLIAWTTTKADCSDAPFQGIETLAEFAGRLCTGTEDKVGKDTPKFIKGRILEGHESIIEHSSATFYVVCSRAVLAEWTRHRIGSYSVRSQRWVKHRGADYYMPPTWQADLADKYRGHMERSWALYNEALDHGIKSEDARYVLPNAATTRMIVTMNMRSWRNFVRLRTSKRALPEIRILANKVLHDLKVIAPSMFDEFKVDTAMMEQVG